MERLDFHVALELCEIFIESATLVAIVFALSACLFMSLNSHRQSVRSPGATHRETTYPVDPLPLDVFRRR
jgi:hypothetical protein